MNFQEYIGQSIGSFTILDFIPGNGRRGGDRNHKFLCRCVCGKTVSPYVWNVIRGKSKSCGCIHRVGNKFRWCGFGDISGRYWYSLTSCAKTRKIQFDISIEKAWELYLGQNKVCALTNLPIGFARNYDAGDWSIKQTASLDRIDSDKGYVLGNVHWVHKHVNKMKMEFSLERFREICRLVTEQHQKELTCPKE